MSAEPAESDVDLLDQMTVTDTWDQEALDHFLDSADAGASAKPGRSPPSSWASRPHPLLLKWLLVSLAAPDVESTFSESSGSSDAFLQNNQDGAEEEGTSEESDQPLVQSDEEDVQPDWSLIGRQGGVG